MVVLPGQPVVIEKGERVQVELFEGVFPYESTELVGWKNATCAVAKRSNAAEHRGAACVPLNADVVDSVLKGLEVAGDDEMILNKSRAAYYHQAYTGNHFFEMRLARHLVDNQGYLPSDLLYENWRLSSKAKGNGPLLRRGVQQVRQCVGEPFLNEMAALIDRNYAVPSQSIFSPHTALANKSKPVVSHDNHVDLFGFSTALKQCAILEAKGSGERFASHQALLLGFAAFLFAIRREELGIVPDIDVELGFVRFQQAPATAAACRTRCCVVTFYKA